jgi:hypothetical protein
VTSSDGTNWVGRVSTNGPLGSVVYANGQFVALSNGGNIVTSADGITWIQHPSGTQQGLTSIAYGNGLFVAVGQASGYWPYGPPVQ